MGTDIEDLSETLHPKLVRIRQLENEHLMGESARISAMADVQEMKEVILKENPSSNKIQQMKEMVQEDINHERQVEEEIRMKELLHLKEKERQKELIKQIRLMEEIEEIQQEHERQQFYHDQEQEMEIKEKELEHEE